MNPEIMKAVGFEKAVKDIKAEKCPTCGEYVSANNFRDRLSLEEFRISGMCQVCQDSIFGTD